MNINRFGLITANGTGTTTIEYNSIENAYSEDIVLGSDTTSPPATSLIITSLAMPEWVTTVVRTEIGFK